MIIKNKKDPSIDFSVTFANLYTCSLIALFDAGG